MPHQSPSSPRHPYIVGIQSHGGVSKGLRAAVGKMLPPLVRILLRNEMAAKSFHELVKQAYVSVALDEFGIGGRAATTSRIAILTGLTRKEVQALLGRPLNGEDRYGKEYTTLQRRHSRARHVG